jgi:hypothetical protein
MAKVVRYAGSVWVALAMILILASYAMIVWHDGWWRLTEILSPYNIWNFAAVVITLSPGLGLLWLADWIEKRNPR